MAAMSDSPSLNFDNPVFSQFAFYAGVVLLKTIFMSFWTARYRNKYEVFANDEDANLAGKRRGKEIKAIIGNPEVERVRRCHLNDLENILPFVLIGLLYVLSGPTPAIAALHFRIFTGARLFHTVAYLTPLPQPSRALSFGLGFLVNVSMSIAVLRTGSF